MMNRRAFQAFRNAVIELFACAPVRYDRSGDIESCVFPQRHVTCAQLKTRRLRKSKVHKNRWWGMQN